FDLHPFGQGVAEIVVVLDQGDGLKTRELHDARLHHAAFRLMTKAAPRVAGRRSSSPPNPATMPRQMPRPSPRPLALLVTKGVKSWSRMSSATPGPLSATRSSIWSATRSIVRVLWPSARPS